MDSHQLKYFVTIAEYEHLTKASEELNISQPALSNAVVRLENELGIHLFDRVGRHIYLNEAGKAYLPYAQDVLKTIEEGQSILSNMIAGREEHITVQSMPLILFPGLLDIILGLCPAASILPTNNATGILTENLLLQKTDLCISQRLLSGSGIQSRLLQSDKAVIVVSDKNLLYQRASVSMADLKDQIFISSSRYSGLSNTLNVLFKNSSFTPKIGYYISSFDEIFGYIETGKCIAATVLSAYNSHNPSKHIKTIDIEDKAAIIKRYLYWNHHNNKAIMHDIKDAVIKYFEAAEKK